MATPNLSPAQITQVSDLVAQYIAAQRSSYSANAVPLSIQESAAISGFFTPQLLADTRLVVLSGVRVPNPAFYPMLRGYGFNNLPDFSTMAATTFSDTVVSHQLFTEGLLFHELVHVEQYRQLGIAKFADLYVRGFLSGGGYFQIPLEQNAYLLGGQYERNPTDRFSVADEVSRWIAENRF
jgi:hypothetical protein